MGRYRIIACIRRDDYAAFAQIIPNDPDFPDTFDIWHQNAVEQITKFEALGVVVKKVVVDPQKFATYCQASGLDANYTTLHAFAVALDSRP